MSFSCLNVGNLTISLQIFHKNIYFVEFLRDVDALGAMRGALTTTDAVVGLAKTGHTAVVAHKESAALLIVLG